MLAPVRKAKKCKHCRTEFTPVRPMQNACGIPCAMAIARAVSARKQAAQVRAERKDDRAKREAFMSVKKLKGKAQDEFNKFIRQRDAALPCVSCGATNPPMKPGGQWDTGHFMSRGAYPELAFNEDNCHKQCKSCNAGAGKFAAKARTVSQDYEAELLNRIGAERLAALKGPHAVKPLDREELIAIKATYSARRRALLKQGETE
jgi:hypothetical protein